MGKKRKIKEYKKEEKKKIKKKPSDVTQVAGDAGNNTNLHHICVIASKDYIIRVLAMYDSLQTHSKQFKLWVCCMDEDSFMTLKKMNLVHMVLIYAEQFETEELKRLRKERKMNEYCWTIKSPFIQHLLVNYQLELVLYCDGDIFFFSDPKGIFDEWGTASIYLCPQRDLGWVEQKYGRYQAGLIGFRNDTNGLQSLAWWKTRCEEWCSVEPDDHRFGDQKYLDELPHRFSNIKISNHLGIDAAPWNCVYNNGYTIQNNNGDIYIENDKLIAYHFACMTIFNEDEFDLWSLGKLKIQRSIINHIYQPYILKLRELLQNMKNYNYSMKLFFSKNDKAQATTFYKYTELRLEMDKSDDFFCFATIMSKEYLIKGLALYQSLIKQADTFHLWICCMDDTSYSALKKLNLEKVTLIPVQEIENNLYSKLKNGRTLTECCWTLKAPFCDYVLREYNEVDHIVYCDADMYFFSNPKPLFDEWSTYSTFLCKQRSTELVEHKHGIYQAGLLGFKQEPNSLMMLNWWKEKCIEWCFDSDYDKHQRWGDQKYLNEIPNNFSNIKIVTHTGIDAAPWNLVMKKEQWVSQHSEKVYLESSELVCFHFGSLLMINHNEYDLWKREKLEFSEPVLNYIYTPYIQELKRVFSELIQKSIITDTSIYYSSPSTDYSPKNLFIK